MAWKLEIWAKNEPEIVLKENVTLYHIFTACSSQKCVLKS